MKIGNQILPFQNFEKTIQNAQKQEKGYSANRIIFLKQNEELLPIEFVVIRQLTIDKIKSSANNQEFDYK